MQERLGAALGERPEGGTGERLGPGVERARLVAAAAGTGGGGAVVAVAATEGCQPRLPLVVPFQRCSSVRQQRQQGAERAQDGGDGRDVHAGVGAWREQPVQDLLGGVADEVLDQLRPGDTLVVWELGRLGRSGTAESVTLPNIC